MKWIYYTAIALYGVIGEISDNYFLNGCLCLGTFMLCICGYLERRKDKND